MNITLDDRLEAFVVDVVAFGLSPSPDAVIAAALELLENRELQLTRLRQEIEAGRRSGEPIPFGAEVIKRRGRKRLGS